ncbi:hypothetical protein CSA56_12235 [candidate division KSB3 bacterium]|uniref:Tetratricopeptide repeat protein n=1 Tax=candidate division KSB3 bacterium TaxID=2044937 RepID=A0A2G6KEE9_9BACT|nr:MAG: hypothetical protein CSA56_12235 [candidate division KSB3 bacterium]
MKEFFIRRKIEKYRRLLDKHGENPRYFQQLAELHGQLSRWEESAQYYQYAIEAYYQQGARLGSDNGFIMDLCRALLDIDPLNRLAYNTLGQEYCGLGEFGEASNLHISFAKKLLKVGQYQEAIEQYRNVLVFEPNNLVVRQSVFSLLWRFRRKAEALQELRKIAELSEKAGNVMKALECYKKAVNISPADTELRAHVKRLTQCVRSIHTPFRLVVNK